MYQIETGVSKFSDLGPPTKNITDGKTKVVKSQGAEGQSVEDKVMEGEGAKGQDVKDKTAEEKSAESMKLARIDDETYFEKSFKGLDRARRAARYQMMMIVAEVWASLSLRCILQ